MKLTSAITAALLAAGSAIALSEEIPSGLAVGGHPQPLQVRDCTGPAAGKTLCYTCRYAQRPTVALFVRELSGPVARLIKGVDDQLAEHRGQRLAAYVVLIADDRADVEAQLRRLAADQNLRRVPLTILRDPPGKLETAYAISPEAAVTVLLWREGTVAAARGFKSPELSDAEIQAVLGETPKVLN